MSRIYHNPACSKSRASLEILNSFEGESDVVEYLKARPGKEELRDLLVKLGLPARSILRTGESVFAEFYSELDLGNDEQVLDAIAKHPILLERPIIVRGNKAVIGRPPENVAKLFQQ